MRPLALLSVGLAVAAAILASSDAPVWVRAAPILPVLLFLPGLWLARLAHREADGWLALAVAPAISAGLLTATALVLHVSGVDFSGERAVYVAAAECTLFALLALRGGSTPDTPQRPAFTAAALALGTLLVAGTLTALAAGMARHAAIRAEERIEFPELWATHAAGTSERLRIGVRQRGAESARYRLRVRAPGRRVLTEPAFAVGSGQTLIRVLRLPPSWRNRRVLVELYDTDRDMPVRSVTVD